MNQNEAGLILERLVEQAGALLDNLEREHEQLRGWNVEALHGLLAARRNAVIVVWNFSKDCGKIL